MTDQPRYSIAEVERRWLVAPEILDRLEGQPYHDIEDLYVAGTRLRLRKVESVDGAVAFKLCKKYGKVSALAEPITNIYLSESEYRLLAGQLQGRVLRKRRYEIAGGGLDVCPGRAIAATFEVEFPSEADAEGYVPPTFVRLEVTNDEGWSGAVLAAAGES